MSRTSLIFRHEFLHTITRKGFIILTLTLPVIALLGIGAGRIVSNATRPSAEAIRIGYVDEGGGFDQYETQGNVTFLRMGDPDGATQAMFAGDIDQYIVIPSDYIATGVIERYTKQKELTPPPAVASAIQTFLSSNLLAGQVPVDVIQRIEAPPMLMTRTLTPAGSVAADQGGYGNFIIPAVFSVLLALALTFTSNYVLQGLSEEKESRLMEILLSSVSTRQLLAGKLLGRGTAGLIQVLFWAALIPPLLQLASSSFGGLLSGIQLPPGYLWIGVLYFILGYSLFAVIALGVAAISSTVREAQGLLPLFTLFSVAPFWFISLLMFFPNSPVWIVFSIVPFSAPVLMMLRLGLSDVPVWQIAASMAVLLLSTLGGLLLSARLLRVYLLRYGKRPHLVDIARQLRAE
jgi:ABC-2 type transport system permease protein